MNLDERFDTAFTDDYPFRVLNDGDDITMIEDIGPDEAYQIIRIA